MTLKSEYRRLGPITLPDWSGRQMYMHTFDPRKPVMAEGFENYETVVATLCRRAGVIAGEVHMTVDEKVVQPGMSQRRPGAHLDGCYMKEMNAWVLPGPPSWAHYCNNLPVERMSIIVASSVAGCSVYPGEFQGEPKNDGDLEHIRGQLGEGTLVPANQGFLLSPDCVHESMIFHQPTQRTFLRIAIPSGGLRTPFHKRRLPEPDHAGRQPSSRRGIRTRVTQHTRG